MFIPVPGTVLKRFVAKIAEISLWHCHMHMCNRFSLRILFLDLVEFFPRGAGPLIKTTPSDMA